MIFKFSVKEWIQLYTEILQHNNQFLYLSCSKGDVWVHLYLYRHNGNCEGHHLSCAGIPDGLNEHPIKSGSPYYVICLQERVIVDGLCPRNTVWEAQTFPYNGSCTQQYAIPNSYYGIGLLPDCAGKDDGHYQYTSRPCDAYYRCDGGVATAVKCPPQTKFDKGTGICRGGVACS